jgi:hypothetical protein
MRHLKTSIPKGYASKIYDRIDFASDPALSKLLQKRDAPLFIACPGPSSVRIDGERVVGQGSIFRMNTFFFEQAPQFGSVVDGYFWSVNADALYDGLDDAVEQRRYDIKTFFTPLEPQRADKDVSKLARYRSLFTPASDHWALIATNGVLGREMMGRPLPTQAFQVLAAAAVLGFREIHLIGVDMYSDASRRYVFDYPEAAKAQVDAKHYTPGYEPGAHGVERDMIFLRAIQSQFPRTRIFNASDVSPLRTVLPDSHLLTGARSSHALAATPVQSRFARLKAKLSRRAPPYVRALRQRVAALLGRAHSLFKSKPTREAADVGRR